MVNYNIKEPFKLADLLYIKECEKIHTDLDNKIRNVKNDFERRGMTNSGLRYSELVKVRLEAFEKLVKFRVQSDLENFSLPITNSVYEKILKKSESIIKNDYPMGISITLEELKRNKMNSGLLEALKDLITNKKNVLLSWVKREIEIHKEKIKFTKSYKNSLYEILKKIAYKLDDINNSFNARFNIDDKEQGILFKVQENKYWFILNEPCNTDVEFKHLIGELSFIIDKMNVKIMKKNISILPSNNLGSINYLEKLLKEHFNKDNTSSIINCFRRIKKIRSYTNPYHPEKPEFKKAINELGLEWPITDYQYTFNAIILDFLNAINTLCEILI
ncbi:MAG: hypothetical protein KAV97_02955 [Actinomycetia bacterium]|nr:hypothetical protein [Actinomycetes bacterium]